MAQYRSTMNAFATLMTIALFCSATAAASRNTFAQEKQKVIVKVLPENSKFTQQHAINVEDFPGHQLRVFEIHRTFPDNPPIINGLKLVEQWNRGITDYTNTMDRTLITPSI
jgi:hypothetical protein